MSPRWNSPSGSTTSGAGAEVLDPGRQPPARARTLARKAVELTTSGSSRSRKMALQQPSRLHLRELEAAVEARESEPCRGRASPVEHRGADLCAVWPRSAMRRRASSVLARQAWRSPEMLAPVPSETGCRSARSCGRGESSAPPGARTPRRRRTCRARPRAHADDMDNEHRQAAPPVENRARKTWRYAPAWTPSGS